MRFSPRTWSLLSVLLFVAAAFFWLKGNEYEERKRERAPLPIAVTNAPAPVVDLLSTRTPRQALASLGVSQQGGVIKDQLYPLRLRNTARSVDELLHDDRALLLANALIDTAGEPLEIPEHLRAGEDPGTYIVQWTGPATPEFRATLARHAASIVSYVPNNAYLVKAGKADIDALRAEPGIQAVLPFEPYYKLERDLLKLAVEQEPLDAQAALRLTLVPGAREEALREIEALGGEYLTEENSPFGPQLIIRPAAHTLPDLARLGAVQGIETVRARVPAADFSRLTLAVATNLSASNYMNLTGSNIWVNINDTGIDTNHPGLRDTMFLAPAASTNVLNTDPEGHGTFVAGLIAGNGAGAAFGTNFPSGSLTNSSFRGMAPRARIIAQPIDPAGEDLYAQVKDSWLIENAAATNYIELRRTNSLISNNSWTYQTAAYDSSAARFDAAVRDALPGTSGPQPLLFVFAAGNAGFGDEDGSGGQVGFIESPGSAKNAITVGALETLRLIQLGITNTNTLYFTNIDGTIETNQFPEVEYPFAGITDSSNQVASFSSRGNVGIGIEGLSGRFKPDVVAPGTMLVSLRSRGWNVTNSVDTNTPYGGVFAALHTNLTEYRFDSGTTFAAANVSGMLALIQEYFESRAPTRARARSMSPALMKALLINGARSLSEFYDLAVSGINFQGWGLPNLPNSLTSFSTNDHTSLSEETWRLRYVDQSAENALATGESRTWRVTLSTNGSVYPLRVTLVWTDPPGNPAVGVKLVNDLDLVITNTETETVFYGNNFFPGSQFTEASNPEPGDILPLDSVNNVENIFIRNPRQYGREFTITVRARRVNVNAVPNHWFDTFRTNDVVQDFALVISSEMGADPTLNDEETYLPEEDAFDEFEAPTESVLEDRPPVAILTNGLPLLTERVGANPTLVGTNGWPAQWNFYVYTNMTISNSFVNVRAGSNVAFVTFNPPNLSRSRATEADIDLYVSTEPALTNLAPFALASALKSREVGGTETVVISNALVGEVFYIGVKSEDQQGAEFSLMGVSSDGPFEQERNGRILLTGVPITTTVLDGSANRPTAATMVAIGISNRRVARAIVTNVITHENLGDLLGVLSHQGQRVVLNNHTLNGGLFSGTNIVLAYDDFTWGREPGTRPSDGPGSLSDFSGTRIVGSWILEMIDNAPSHTGRVEALTIAIDPLRQGLLAGDILRDFINPNDIAFYPIDLPPGVTNINFRFFEVRPPGSTLEVFLRANEIPQTNVYDFRTNILAPGGIFDFPTTNSAPLQPGTYFLAVRNPTGVRVDFALELTFAFNNDASSRFNFDDGAIGLPDDATASQTIFVDDDKLVADTRVGVIMRHPRSSDTVLSLISPQGTRVMLAENRGYTNTLGYGSSLITTNATNLYYAVFTDDTNLARLPVKFVNLGALQAVAPIAQVFTNGFEGVQDRYYPNGQSVGPWIVNSVSNRAGVSVLTGSRYAYEGTNVLSLGSGIIRTNVPGLIANRPYRLTFALRAAPFMPLFNTGINTNGVALNVGSIDPHYRLIESPHPTLRGPNAIVTARRPTWAVNTLSSRWISYSTNQVPDARIGRYRYRTYINMYEQDTVTNNLRLRWSASDDLAAVISLNGNPLAIAASPANLFNTADFEGISVREGLNVLDFEVNDDNIGGLRVEFDPDTQLVNLKDPNPDVVVNVGGRRQTFGGLTNWTIASFDFIATSNNVPVQFESSRGEIWIDAVRIESSNESFIQPEEPLTAIRGERSFGDWTLEVRDARSGEALPVSDVVAWKLDLQYAQPLILAERLTEGSNFPLTPPQVNPTNRMRGGILFTNQTHYFAIYPCSNATEVTVTLAGFGNFDAIEMLADHSGIPTGDPETDDFLPLRNNENPGSPAGRAVFHLTTSDPAPARLIPGKPFFLAVRNRFINRTNVYTLRVDSDASCAPPPPPVLSAGQTVQSALAAASAGAATEGDIFAVNVGAGASSVNFNVEASGDVMIVAQYDAVPTRDFYSHIQDVAGSGNEELRISGAELTAGLWYVRVLNNTSDLVTYALTATGDIIEPGLETHLSAALEGGLLLLTWPSQPGRDYVIEYSTDLQSWAQLATVTAQGSAASYSDSATHATQRFYRISLQQ